jgi:Tol biopolymer transport system component
MVMLAFVVIQAQLRITGMEKLPLDRSKEWDSPQFSSDGKTIYFTTVDFNGIWEYSSETQKTRQITADQKSGYGFALSPDGKQIAYRRTMINARSRRKLQELVVKNLTDGKLSIKATGTELSLPAFSGSAIVYSVGIQMKSQLSTSKTGPVSLLGIENTKIVLLRDGKKVLYDPLGNGSYVWPALSLDRTRLVAYEMARGAFVCDLEGNILSRLGKRDAPVWTRDGKWIVYMNDKDDGHRVISSDLFCLSPDNKQVVQLTDTEEIGEIHPQCSPTENKIVCSTLGGEIYVLSYEETGR